MKAKGGERKIKIEWGENDRPINSANGLHEERERPY